MKNRENPQNNRFSLKEKYFWAPFLNLAQHNVFITLEHINNHLSGDSFSGNEQEVKVLIQKWWKIAKGRDIDKKARLRDALDKHFPFLKAASYAKELFDLSKDAKGKKRRLKEVEQEAQERAYLPEKLIARLDEFLERLNAFRNYFSHYRHSSTPEIPSISEDFEKQLYAIFDASVRMVKEDHKKNSSIHVQSHFDHLIRVGKNKNPNPKFKHHFYRDNSFSEAGLLFFTSLFLAKEDAFWMQKKVTGFKSSRILSEQMTNEVFCRSRICIPKLKLESVYDTDRILLDMFNELVRCPQSLFERLQENDKEQFRIPADEEEHESGDELGDDDLFKYELVRGRNRFPYFALRFFDLNEVFNDLRFQISLGNYHFSVYDKKIGGFTEKRHLTRNLYGFSRLQDFTSSTQPEAWQKLVKELDYNESSNEPFISRSTPHYHIAEQKIGMRFGAPDNLWPRLEVVPVSGVRNRYKYDDSHVAEAFLSVYELMPMMFYYLLVRSCTDKREAGQKVEGVIRRTQKKIHEIYDAFEREEINSMEDLERRLSKTNILKGHLPERLIALLQEKPQDMEIKAERKLNELISQTEKRIVQIKKQNERKIKIGKRGAGLLKPGIIADWLVKDMMRFQPVAKEGGVPLNNSKANSTEYQLLQRTFALYGSEKNRLHAYFNQLRLINSDNPHPFLNQFKWDEQTNLTDFYQSYLKARQKYLKGLKPEDWKDCQHFLLLKVHKTDRSNLVRGWKNGLNLPRGMFTQPIFEWLREKNPESLPADFISDENRVGFIARVIPLYFLKVHKDRVQTFYDCPFNVGNTHKTEEANYLPEAERRELWKKLKATIACPENPEKEPQKWKDYLNFKEWKEFERQLRLIKNQDILLWLMCKELMADKKVQGLTFEELRLEDLGPEMGHKGSLNILNQVVPMRLPLTIYPEDSKGAPLRKEQPVGKIYLEAKDTKLLKQGNFRALLKDRRLNGLFSFADWSHGGSSIPVVDKKTVEHELGEYQSLRVEVFKMTLGFEEYLIKQNPRLPTDNFRTMIETWLNGKSNDEKKELEAYTAPLIAVRNAFSHNQYPAYNKACFHSIRRIDLTLPEAKLNIALQLKELVQRCVERITASEM